MDLPLVLRAAGGKRLVYGIPLWYRLAMALIALIVGLAILVGGGSPGPFAWIVLALSLLGALYEERWVFDAEAGELRHRYGLLFAARKIVLPFEGIQAFRLRPFVRGTVPGSEDERKENEAALARSREEPSIGEAGKRRFSLKRPFLTLVCEEAEGGALVLNSLPARKGEGLRLVGSRIAAFCGKDFLEG